METRAEGKRRAWIAITMWVASAMSLYASPQEKAPRARTESTLGLLLSVSDAGDGFDRHASYWIAVHPEQRARPVRLLGLIVPTGRTFRRFAISKECMVLSRDGREAQPPKRADRDTPAQDQECTESLIEWIPGSKAPTYMSEPSSDVPCSYRRLDITFASPAVISLKSHSGRSEECEPRGFHWYEYASVRRHLQPSPILLSDFLGQKGREAYERAAVEARRAWRRDFEIDDDSDSSCQASGEEDSGWYVSRRDGRWAAELKQQNGDGSCIMEAPIDAQLPPSLLGFREPAVPWELVRARYPDAEDAHVAPGGKHWLIVGRNGLLLTTPDAFEIARLPTGAVIQVQWASGRNVAIWQTALGRFDRRPSDAH
jgi:hypothetical protein